MSGSSPMPAAQSPVRGSRRSYPYWDAVIRALAAFALPALAAGCGCGASTPPGMSSAPQGAAPAPAAPAPTAPAPTAPAAPAVDPRAATALAKESAGPVRLGMAEKEVRALPNLTVLAWKDRKLEGEPAPALRLVQFGMPLGYAELEKGRVWRIVILTDRYRTTAGAGVGTRARDLERSYGPGQVLTGEGNVCATFRGAPGISFCFENAASLGNLRPGDWSRLAARNPRVQRVLIVGEEPTPSP